MSDEDKARMVEMLNARGNAEAVRTAFDAGRAALAAGDFAGAIEQFSTAAESDDQHVILANLAQAYSGAGQHAEAADAYRRALVQDPENGVYQQNMGIALGNSGDVDGAVEAISRAAELDPLSAGSAYYNLGIIFINRAQMDQAVNAFRQSIAAAADHAPAYYQLGLALVGTAPAEAVEPLEKFLDLAPDDPNAATAQGLLDFARTQ
jgi:tetratricopeptide (TPR) repeat protein